MATRTAVRPMPNRRPQPQAVDADPVEIDNPLQFLMDTGLLFEINRTYLHQCGYIMSIRPDDNNNRRLILSIYDCSANPAAALFEPDVFERSRTKWLTWWRTVGVKAQNFRKSVLGITIQTKPDYREQPNSKG